jgi:replication-associated recombination protein RarA
MLPSTYKPSTPDQFIGSARPAATMLKKLIDHAEGAPLKLLLLGKPGIGKSAVVDWLLTQIPLDTFGSIKANGTGFKIEQAAELEASFRLTSLFSDRYRAIRIEEVDKVPTAAQVRLLTALDDMPNNTLFIATSNCESQDLEERFQSRFQVFEVQPPSNAEVAELIQSHWDLPADTARSIAALANGNVRQALLDVQTALFSVAA